MLATPKPSGTVAVVLKGAAAAFEPGLHFDGLYRFHATAPCWITQGFDRTEPTKGEPGSMPVAAGESLFLRGSEGAVVAVLGDKGVATLTPVTLW